MCKALEINEQTGLLHRTASPIRKSHGLDNFTTIPICTLEVMYLVVARKPCVSSHVSQARLLDLETADTGEMRRYVTAYT